MSSLTPEIAKNPTMKRYLLSTREAGGLRCLRSHKATSSRRPCKIAEVDPTLHFASLLTDTLGIMSLRCWRGKRRFASRRATLPDRKREPENCQCNGSLQEIQNDKRSTCLVVFPRFLPPCLPLFSVSTVSSTWPPEAWHKFFHMASHVNSQQASVTSPSDMISHTKM